MSAVTIPKDMHERMIKTFRLEYQDEFGDLEEKRTYSRAECIAKYAADIAFWKRREPVIDPNRRKPDMRVICAHAIATNAQSAMWRICEEKNITAEVEEMSTTIDAR